MVHWKEVLTQISPDAEGRMAELLGRLYAQMGDVGPVKVITFRGYGTPEHLFLRGRVIEEKTHLAGEKDDRVWANLVHIYTRAQCVRVPHAVLAARFQNVEQLITADEDGFFEAHFQPTQPLVKQRVWHTVEIQLVSPIPEIQSRYPIKTTGQVLVPSVRARYGVISTVDRTLLPSAPDYLELTARNAFLRNPRPRLPFPGEAALYQAFYGGISGMDMNPHFYVSSDFGNLYDLLVQHINLQNMPNGPVLFARNDPLNRIRRMINLYPDLPFLLIGDAEQQDAEIFTSLACEYPGRIPAIYLRSAGLSTQQANPRQAGSLQASCLKALAKKAEQVGSRLVLAKNALSLARLAVEQGFLLPTALRFVAEDMQKDERPLSPLEALINEAGENQSHSPKISRQAVQKDGSSLDYSTNAGELVAWPAPKQPARRSGKKNK